MELHYSIMMLVELYCDIILHNYITESYYGITLRNCITDLHYEFSYEIRLWNDIAE